MIYADNAATTQLSEAALCAMLPFFREQYGNPSSLHSPGQTAAEALFRAREAIARCLNCSPREIFFTSCGTESDNQALRTAAAWGAAHGKRHIISTAFEHHAVLRTLEALEQEGFQVELLDVSRGHNITAAQVEAAIRPDTCLVSAMFANNEIGSVLPVAGIGAVCRRNGVLFHTDAVQAAGQLPIDVQAQCIDLLSLSAHKFHGPKGIGALYCRRDLSPAGLILGGAQERGRRAGTENVPAIVGMAAALTESCDHMEENRLHVTALRDQLIDGLSRIPHCVLNGDPLHRLPGNVSFCFEGVEGEALLLLLDQRGIAAGSGSACASGSLEPSHVLLAVGRPRAIAHSSLRLSLSHTNTQDDADGMLRAVPEIVAKLRGTSPIWRAMEDGSRPHLI